ncbi:MAG: TerC family protein [Verrucomicrobia bacterium]|nr:TerC family protein [Verrucomicrobiota bacterium]
MLAWIQIEWWHYATFIVGVLFVVALDLGVFHRRARVVKFREALAWTCLWVSLSLLFAWTLVPTLGPEEAQKFLLGYILELSLSMDNVFVIALIFGYFRVPITFQHRVLFWGIMGAFVMRGIMIAFGAALVSRFEWILYVFGFFLLVTGAKMVFTSQEGVHPEKNPVIRLARRFFPVTDFFVGQSFVVRQGERLALTPLALVLLMVETTDLIFAVDSIPAIFGVTKNPFIVFTSNVFAILGLRSLYFVLANLIGYFRYLKLGLSFVLVFIGLKMLLDPHGTGGLDHGGAEEALWFQLEIPTGISLGVVGGILFSSILASLGASFWEQRRNRVPGPAAPP